MQHFHFSLLILPCQMIFKSLFYGRDHIGSRSLQGHEKPERKKFQKIENSHQRIEQRNLERPDKVVDDLDSAEDREASEKAHGAPYQTQLGLHCHLQN